MPSTAPAQNADEEDFLSIVVANETVLRWEEKWISYESEGTYRYRTRTLLPLTPLLLPDPLVRQGLSARSSSRSC